MSPESVKPEAHGAPFPARALAELTRGLVDVPAGIMVSDVTQDSRAASPGALFLACRGDRKSVV